MSHRMIRPLGAVLLGAAVVLSGCNDEKTADAAPAQEQKKSLPVVDVWTAQAQAVEVSQNLPGRLEASREAVIVPRISGIVEKRLFNEGGFVKAGQPLYQLDDGTYRAAVQNARAQLQSAQASLQQAKANRDLYRSTVNRYAPLVKANAISKLEYDQAVANMKVQESNMAAAQASMEAAKATIDSAEISQGYAAITAPIAGVIGKSAVTEGAYVSASTTQMATIQQLDPMNINITQSAGELLKLKKALQSGQVQGAQNKVQILLDDGTPYDLTGSLLFLDQSVDADTGQVSLRAQVPNPNGDLLPGLYVRVVVPQSTYPHAYLVPQQAVTRGAQNTVMIAEQDGSFHPQTVTVAGQQGGSWIVTDGLTDGQQVIVDGMNQLPIISGAKQVQTREWSPNAPAETAGQEVPAGEQGAEQAGEQAAAQPAEQTGEQTAQPAEQSTEQPAEPAQAAPQPEVQPAEQAQQPAQQSGAIGARDLTQDGAAQPAQQAQ